MEKGEILGLLGPNGAGKTTTIQMLLGVLRPTGGAIHVFGKEFNKHREEILEKMNFSSTYTNLPWGLTVLENLTYISFFYSIPERKKRIAEVVEAFRLEKLLNQEMTELSAGQLTRVNLAKAFLNDPKILLLDEPTASLDPEIAAYIREYIVEQRNKKQISILFTSHNMPEVEEICDRVLFINNGTIIANDTPVNLAKSLDFCRVHLVVKQSDVTRLEHYCRTVQKLYKSDRNTVSIEIKESEIAQLLQDIAKEDIRYLEISIDKPDLEDYFLSVAQKKTSAGMEQVI